MVIVSQAIKCDNITKKKASINLFALGKDVHFVFGTVLYFSSYLFAFGYRQRLQNNVARIHIAMIVAMVNVIFGFEHRVYEVFCG